jgi:NAD(P)-dependent dehydrogenase (short-subunit alcohol dehydrogenase family)
MKKVILVTGCSGGIGEGICKIFKDDIVIGLDIVEPKHNYCDIFKKIDLRNEKELKELSKNIDKLDCLVNNAGYQICKTLDNTESKEWDDVFDVNLKASFLLSKYFKDKLSKNNGSIINISSVHSLVTSKGIGAYSVSKAGISGLTRTLAIELSEYNIRVNSIVPGAIDTKMLREHLSVDEIDKMKKKHLLKRIGTVKDVAEMVLFLSDNNKSGFITGQNIVLDGGVSILLSSEI